MKTKKFSRIFSAKKIKIFSFILIPIILFFSFAILNTYSKQKTVQTMHVSQPITDNTNLLDGTWSYMPGVKKAADGYTIAPTHLSIVEQDGRIAQANPPVNLAGTHLEGVKGDFSITAEVRPDTASVATIQLYGQPPVIADEFRVERESMQINIDKGVIAVKVWNGKTQNASVRAIQYTPAKKVTLTIARQGKNITFTINNKVLRTIADEGIFAKGQVWFGLDSKNGMWTLTGLRVAKGTNGSFIIADGSTVKLDRKPADSLQALAAKKRPDFIVGGAMALGPLTSDSAFAAAALGNFGSLTPENGMKMINLQPEKGVYTFEQADALVKIAKQNNLTIHGHTLVFGEANPPWFNALPVVTTTDKQLIKDIMIDHVTTVVKHFGADVKSWDVINEPLADYDEFEQGQIMRTHKWYQAMGESYIVTAMDAAHKANPNATLFINEFGLEEDGERWDAFLALLDRLKPQLTAQGIPMSSIGVGFQSHVYESDDKINPTILKKHIEQLEKRGIKAQVSEMDVYSDDGEAVQGQQFSAIFTACLEEKNCVAWRTWIISDKYDYWKDDNGMIETGEDGLFSATMQPRAGYTSILNSLR